MSDDFLASVQQEGTSLDEIFSQNGDEQVKETPAESPAENNQTEKAPSPQGAPAEEGSKPPEANTEDANNVPFHKHPRWMAMVEENRKLKESVESINAFKAEAETKLQGVQNQKPNPNIPKEFAELFGENPEAWERWQKLEAMRLQNWEAEQKRQQEELQKQQAAQEKQWQDWVNTSIQKIEETHNVKLAEKSSERNEFMDFMNKRMPSDENGNIDFLKGWEWFQEIKQLQSKTAEEKSNTRKNLAASSMSGKKSESKPTVLTPNDLRGKSWHSFIE